jgi:hypothetical protein
MTLIQTIVSPAGVWQVGDNLLWDVEEKRPRETDFSIKHLVVRCSDGGMLIGYTGVGILGTYDVSDWMRRALRGNSTTIDGTLLALRDAANADLAHPARKAGIHHSFIAGILLGGRPWAATITNLSPDGMYDVPPRLTFETSALEVPHGQYLVAGSGRGAIANGDGRLCDRLAKRHPARPDDFLRVLADVNRRAAESSHPAATMVTASSVGVYMPASLEPLKLEVFHRGATEAPVSPAEVPVLLFGVDLKETSRAVRTWSRSHIEGTPLPEHDAKALLERAGRASVDPTHRVTGGPRRRRP